MGNGKLGLRIAFSVLLVACSIACSVTSPGDTDSLVAELDAKLPAAVSSGNSPSIQVAVVQGDQIIWSEAFGDNTSDTSVDHVYMNASVQKAFTAAAVLQLVESGHVDPDADIQEYVPFPARHPEVPNTPITVRMLLVHRSGLDAFPHQFAWDTDAGFSPQYRTPGPDHLRTLSHEEFLGASLMPGGSNYDERAWILIPGERYHYSVSAYPLLRYLASQVAGQSCAGYVSESIFALLGMTSWGFSAEGFAGRHATPYTRIDGQNIELPMWDGQGAMMHTTAGDMVKFMLAVMNDGLYGDVRVLQPETVEPMQQRTSRFKVLFKSSDDLPP